MVAVASRVEVAKAEVDKAGWAEAAEVTVVQVVALAEAVGVWVAVLSAEREAAMKAVAS